MDKNVSYNTKIQNFIKMIDDRIHAVFNRNFFGIYEGRIEVINDIQATLNVSVQELDNIIFENCRVVIPGVSSTSKILPKFEVGANVLILFTSFKLSNPIIIGQLSPVNAIHSALQATEINITNGAGSIRMSADGTINIIGTSLTLNGSSIVLSGDTITANGEDLTVDDKGAL